MKCTYYSLAIEKIFDYYRVSRDNQGSLEILGRLEHQEDSAPLEKTYVNVTLVLCSYVVKYALILNIRVKLVHLVPLELQARKETKEIL